MINGCDFQWQPAVLFWEGINHYQKFISNGKSDFLCQGGEYGHLFNIILFPYTLVKWEIARAFWVITNIIFLYIDYTLRIFLGFLSQSYLFLLL